MTLDTIPEQIRANYFKTTFRLFELLTLTRRRSQNPYSDGGGPNGPSLDIDQIMDFANSVFNVEPIRRCSLINSKKLNITNYNRGAPLKLNCLDPKGL